MSACRLSTHHRGRKPIIVRLNEHTQDDGDFLRALAEAVLQLMKHDVEGLVGAGRYERGDGRQT